MEKTSFLSSVIDFTKKYGIFDTLFHSCIILLLICFCTLAIVWISGRYLNILKTDFQKNLLAIFLMLLFTPLYTALIDYYNLLISAKIVITTKLIIDFSFLTVVHFSFAILVYAIVCWKFYDKAKKKFDEKIKKI